VIHKRGLWEFGRINDAWWVSGYPKTKNLAFIGGRKRKKYEQDLRRPDVAGRCSSAGFLARMFPCTEPIDLNIDLNTDEDGRASSSWL
jgi:hypothetical protein